MSRSLAWSLLPALTALLGGCAWQQDFNNGAPKLRYVGSSTIANFIREAEPIYGKVRFVVDTQPESVGGELAIRDGRADVAGVAGNPKPETLELGVVATLIGKDAIAVVVNQDNPVSSLTREQLKGIFTGKIRNWKEIGGSDLEIRPYTVGAESATRKVFRSAILGEADDARCEVVRPDASMSTKVGADSRAIDQISFSFLHDGGHVKALTVDGQEPVPSNPDYPITRPLYLLWWEGRARVAEFITWTTGSPEAKVALLK